MFPLVVAMLPVLLILYFFPRKPKLYPSPLNSKSLRHYLQKQLKWLLLSGFTIGPRLTCQPVFMERSLRDAPPPNIFYNPSGLGVRHLHSEWRSIVWRSGLYLHVSHCDVQQQGPPLLQLGAWCTVKVCRQPSHLFLKLGGLTL